MRKHINRIISITLAAAMSVSMISSISVSAEEITAFPYTLFAASEAEGAITTTAGNFCVNGNVCTNGTIVAGGNINVNGTKTENAGQDMIYIFDKIDTKYFSGSDVEEHTEDYILDEININISEPTEVLGEAELTGNININTALKAFKDVTLNGEVKNTNDSVIFSKYGDIVIDSTNVNLNGLVYAPFGSVEVKAMNLNLNNVVIIADSIVLDCPNVNANYSTNAADFVGTVSEPLNIPKDEWQYMKDENGNGLPDFFEVFGNWEKLADADGDGLPDSIEEYLGSDSNNIDTDGDGLGDYYEVFVTYTDPTMADTDENGISDADEDFDEDGLTNLDELLNNTYPYIDDSDNDGLSDGAEVNEYGTDPLVADTDGDELEDGDEIILGTNPLVQDTDGDGIIDSKEKFQQTFTHKVKNEDCAVTKVIVEMECTGNINKTTSVESNMNTDILCTDVVGLVGEPFEIETESEFDKATLTFKINKDKLGEIPFDNLLFLWYNEDENEFVELETTLDAENSTASIATTHFSKYMVVDRQAWFDNWREIYARFENLSEKSPSITAICVDCSGSMRTNDNFFYIEPYVQTCYRDIAVKQFVNAMFTNDQTSIITFASNATKKCSLTSDKDLLLKNASFYSNGGTNANAAINIALKELDGVSGNKSIILMSDGDVNVSEANIEIASKNKIKIHSIALGNGANSTTLKQYAENTGGEFFIVQSSSGLKDIYNNLSAKNQLNFDNLSDKDGDGVPDDIEISGIPMPNGKLVFTNPNEQHTDGDGLTDGDEVGKMRRSQYFPSDVPDCALTYKFSFDVTSDPTSVDGDGDGFEDSTDVSPLKAICFVDFDHYKQFRYGEKTTFTVFVDQPYVGSRDVINTNDQNEYVGHTYVGIDSGKDYKEYAGFWPKEIYRRRDALVKNTVDGRIRLQGKAYTTYGDHSDLIDPYLDNSGNIYLESDHKWDIACVWQRDDLKLGSLNDFTAEYYQQYNMMTNNCTTFAVESMYHLYITPNIYQHHWYSEHILLGWGLNALCFKGYSPADAGEDIRKNSDLYIYIGEETDSNGNVNKGVMEGHNW